MGEGLPQCWEWRPCIPCAGCATEKPGCSPWPYSSSGLAHAVLWVFVGQESSLCRSPNAIFSSCFIPNPYKLHSLGLRSSLGGRLEVLDPKWYGAGCCISSKQVLGSLAPAPPWEHLGLTAIVTDTGTAGLWSISGQEGRVWAD